MQTFDAAGVSTGTFTFPGPGPLRHRGGPNTAIFVAISARRHDLRHHGRPGDDDRARPPQSPAGGKVCWDGSTPDQLLRLGQRHGRRSRNALQRVRRIDLRATPRGAASTSAGTSRPSRPATTPTTAPTTGSPWFPIRSRTSGTPGDHAARDLRQQQRSKASKAATTATPTSGDGCSAVCKPEPVQLLAGGLVRRPRRARARHIQRQRRFRGRRVRPDPTVVEVFGPE